MEGVPVRTVIVLVAAIGAFLAAPLAAQTPEPSRWWSEVDRVDAFLREGRWKTAGRAGDRLRRQVMELSWHEPDLGQVFSELAFQAAVVHANRGDDEAAIWEWHAAQCLERVAGRARGGTALAERGLAPYGRAAQLFPAHPLRERGEAPPGEELPQGTLFLDFEAAIPPSYGVLRLRNVNVGRVRLPPVAFEVWVHRDGRMSHPVVTSPWSPPVMLQWGLDNLRVMPRFEPARYQGEPVGSLENVELELGELSKF